MSYRYIGSKARVASKILDCIGFHKKGDGVFIDAFCGTGSVAELFAENGWPVLVNDSLESAVIQAEGRLLSSDDVSFSKFGGYDSTIALLNKLPKRKGFFWEEYSPASLEKVGIERKYFTEKNAKKIDAVNSKIHEWYSHGDITQKEFSLLMSNLISAVNEIANIAGTYGCFFSKWSPKSLENFVMERAELKKKKLRFTVSNKDVFQVESHENDIVYLDPPYTKRQYASYYHILETLVAGDRPTIEGTSGLRPWKKKSSVFCYKTKALEALTKLTTSFSAKRVYISYSNEGYISLDDLVNSLKKKGNVKVIRLDQIARYAPNSEAAKGKKTVQEYLIRFKKEDR